MIMMSAHYNNNNDQQKIKQRQELNYSVFQHLSKDEIQFFIEKGYLHIQSIITPSDCIQYDQQTIQPALQKFANLHEKDKSTWFIQNNDMLKPFLTQSVASMTGDYNNEDHDVPAGIMVHDKDNKEHNCDPMSVEDSNWSALFDNERFIGILDELHQIGFASFPSRLSANEKLETNNGLVEKPNHCDGQEQKASRNKRRWEYLHHGVGWIHVRLPVSLNHTSDDFSIDTKKLFYIPQGEKTWHVDGGHFTPHKISSPEQSVIVLPCLRDISINGGNTLILSGSHVHIAKKLYKSKEQGVDKLELNKYCEELASKWPIDDIIEAAPCSAGDILLLHPFLVHSAGRNYRKINNEDMSGRETGNLSSNSVDNFRITFNIGTRWKEPIIFPFSDSNPMKRDTCETISVLEYSITKNSLS